MLNAQALSATTLTAAAKTTLVVLPVVTTPAVALANDLAHKGYFEGRLRTQDRLFLLERGRGHIGQ